MPPKKSLRAHDTVAGFYYAMAERFPKAHLVHLSNEMNANVFKGGRDWHWREESKRRAARETGVAPRVFPAEHRFLRRVLPLRAFAAVRAGTKEWLAACPCGHKRDIWDYGGVRYKATGEPLRLLRCPACGRMSMHRVRKKTEIEKHEIP